MSELRILTVRQPWAWAIIHGSRDGVKDVENRVRNVAGDYRGPVAIHAGRSFDDDAPIRLVAEYVEASRVEQGAIIGVVDLADVLPPSYYDEADANDAYCSPWAEPGCHQLVLEHPRPLAEPIPYKGALGLRRLDVETTAAVWSQIGEKP